MRVRVAQLVMCCLMWVMPPAGAETCNDWRLWQAFRADFIQTDGRVLADESEQRYSTSEGQTYALFFALLANDRGTFDRILIWTRDNMASGDLGGFLPAWQWGKKPDGVWGVVDKNSASDADVWLAYTLLEAGRLWKEPRYSAMGKLVLANIRIHLVRDLTGIGSMLIPAETGFDLESGGVRLNPSYFPVQVLRNFSTLDPTGPWRRVTENYLRMLESLSIKGYVPDWAAYMPGRGYLPDPKGGSIGSYDAVRVYLWWGMLSRQDPMYTRLRKVIFGMNRLIPKQEALPPLTADAQSGVTTGVGPPSFSAALLPYFESMNNNRALKLQQERLLSQQDAVSGVLIGHERHYYDQVLTLFGQGWLENRFRFSPQGQLDVKWKDICSTKK